MKELYIFSDFDGTITLEDLGDRLFIEHGQFEPYHSLLLQHKLDIRQYWRHLFASLPPKLTPEFIAQWAAAKQLDPYFADFVQFCKTHSLPLAVVSDGFDVYIEPVLANIEQNIPKIYCNKARLAPHGWQLTFPLATEACRCLVASCKRNAMLKDIPTDAFIIFIGDGYSDFCAAHFADLVFAKRALARYCFEQKIPHHSWRSFFDIIQVLLKILHSKKLNPRHQARLRRMDAFKCE